MVKNKRQREFLDNGIINTVSSQKIEDMLKDISGNHQAEARAMVIALYYSGARPKEILLLKSKNIYKEGSTILIELQGTKRGLGRKIQLPYQRPLIKQLYEYSISHPPEMFLFYHFKGLTIKYYKNKKGEIKEYEEISARLRYYFKKWWGDEFIPYFFRHNCFSILSEVGYADAEIKYLKGARTLESVTPYTHLSRARAKKLKTGFNKF